MSEKAILEQCKHPFIVHLACTFQDKRHLYMVLEYVIGGEFFTHLRNAGRLDATASRFYSAQVALIFESLFQQKAASRILSPASRISQKMVKSQKSKRDEPYSVAF